MKHSLFRLVMVVPLVASLAACVGVQTFTPAARQGDTVALAVGWNKNLKRSSVTVTITDAAGVVTTYLPDDPHVRSIVNLYPDPVSRAVVGTMTNQDLSYGATNTGYLINTLVTKNATGEHDNDWRQTTMLMDLPDTMATGLASVRITSNDGSSVQPIGVTILPGAGSSNMFDVPFNNGTVSLLSSWPQLLGSMERADNYTMTFSAPLDANGNPIIPHSIELKFTHTPNVHVATSRTWSGTTTVLT
jgi:hypothetical protein